MPVLLDCIELPNRLDKIFNSFDYFASFGIGQSAKRNKYTGSRRGLLALFSAPMLW